jgi:hypothetical protein
VLSCLDMMVVEGSGGIAPQIFNLPNGQGNGCSLGPYGR